MSLKIELAVVRPQPEADTHLDEKVKIVKLDSTQAQSVAVSENEFKGCYSIILSLQVTSLASTQYICNDFTFSTRIFVSYGCKVVLRLYNEARSMDNLTDCVNINKERAGWDCR